MRSTWMCFRPMSPWTISARRRGALSHRTGNRPRLLAKELGYLPLALSHAAAFCRARDTDFKDYLEKLAERVKEKPDRRSRAGKDYPWSVYETFELGLERVLAGQPELGVPPQPRAEELMGIMAYLGSDGIPLDLFPESLFSRDELSGLIAALNEAALLTRTRLPGGAARGQRASPCAAGDASQARSEGKRLRLGSRRRNARCRCLSKWRWR